MQSLADLAVREALTDQVEDPSLLLGQGSEPFVVLLSSAKAFEHPLSGDRIEQGPAGGHLANGLDEVVAPDVFQYIAGGPRHDRIEEGLVIGIGGQHQAANVWQCVAYISADLHSAAIGKAHIKDGHIGTGSGNAVQRISRRARLADHVEISFQAQQISQSAADDLVVIEQEHLDRHGHSVASLLPDARGCQDGHWPTRPQSRGSTMTETPVQLLTPEGERIDHPDYPLDVSPDDLRTMYRDIAITRRMDVESTALQRTGELGLWCPTLGQEGVQVGAGHAMRLSDYGFTTYRESGIFHVRGVEADELLQLYRGNTHASWDQRRVGLGLFTIVIGSHALHAVGSAMGIQRDGTDDAVLACFGDGATSTGDVHEAMVFATAFSSPVVFLVQNNQWAISVPVGRQARAPLSVRASGYGIPSVRIDGNDVLAGLAVTRALLDRAREGGGPAFIEAVTYRRGPHTTSDDPTRYRDEAELDHWASLDPLDRLRRHMERVGAIDDAFVAEVDAEADALGERLREAIRGMDDPEPLGMFDHVYAEPHPQVTADRAAMAGYLASGEGS